MHIWCSELPTELVECCTSCHNDWDNGFSEPFDEPVTPSILYFGCCSAANISRKTLVQYLWDRRKTMKKTTVTELRKVIGVEGS